MSTLVHKVSDKVHKVKSNLKAEKTILVTGASGFLGTHVVNEFLSHGYHVVGTVRNHETVERVKKAHPKFTNTLSFAIVEDIASPGAFDEAVKGVDGVIHTASPFQLKVEDNERDLLKPALNGTVGILESIKAHNPDIERVVITSSFAAVFDPAKGDRPGYTYTEADWNPVTYDAAVSGHGAVAYCASKTFAEKAAFDFVERENPNFSIATLCPPMVYGPTLQSISDLAKLNTSSADIYRLMNGSQKEIPPTPFKAYVDVRDVATAHRLAYEKSEAANERYIIASDNFNFQQVCDIIRKDYPTLKPKVPEGVPGRPLEAMWKIDNSKAQKELGMTLFRRLEVIVYDTVFTLAALERALDAAKSTS